MSDPGQAAPYPIADGAADLDRLSHAGFTPEQLVQYKDEETQRLMQGGFKPQEIAKHWGDSVDRIPALDKHIKDNLASLPPDQVEEATKDPIKLLQAGWQNGNLGMMTRGKTPDLGMDPEAGLLGKTAFTVGQMASDAPAMIAGALGGGLAGAELGPVGALAGGGAGAAALPEAMRQIMLDSFKKGEVHSASEFMAMAGRSTWETAKAGIAGAAGGLVGGVAGTVARPLVGQTAAGAIEAATNAGAFGAVAAGLDGHDLSPQDFIEGAFIGLATHGAVGAIKALPPAAKSFTDRLQKAQSQQFQGPTLEPRLGRRPLTQEARTGDPVIDALTSSLTDVIDGAKIDRTRTIPNSAGASTPIDNPVTYIDKSFPKEITVDGKTIDPAEPLLVHENVENQAMNLLTEAGMDRSTALKVAYWGFGNPAEHAVVQARGINPEKYEAAIKPELDRIAANAKGASDIPADLFKGTYPNGDPRAETPGPISKPTEEELQRGKDIINAAVHGTLPPVTPDSFQKAMDHIQGNLEALYVKTGIPPWKLVEMSRQDAVVRDELFSQTAAGDTLAPNINAMAPPDPPPNHMPEGLLSTRVARLDPGIPGHEYRINNRERVTETRDEIAGYLKEIGRKLRFSIQIGPSMREEIWGEPTENFDSAKSPFFNTFFDRDRNGRVTGRGRVYATEDSDAQYRAWFGLSTAEVLWHEVGHAIDANIISGNKDRYIDTVNEDGNRVMMPDLKTARVYEPPDIKAEMEMASRNFKPKLWEKQPVYNGKPNELMADAIAVWISDPTAAAKMPEFTKKFGHKLEPLKEIVNKYVPARVPNAEWTTKEQWQEKQKEKREANKETVPDYHQLVMPGGGGGGKGPPGPWVPPSPKKEWGPIPEMIEGRPVKSPEHILEDINNHIGVLPGQQEGSTPASLYRQMVNELGPARDIDKMLHDPDNGFDRFKDAGVEDALRQTLASRNRAEYFVGDEHGWGGTVRPDVIEPITLPDGSTGLQQKFVANPEGPTLQKAFARARKDGGTEEGFRGYLLALRTVGRGLRGQETGLNFNDMVHFAIEEGPKYSEATKIWNETNNNVLYYARDRGFMNQAQVDAIINSDQFAYITMRRVLGDDAMMRGRQGRTFLPHGAIYKMEGSNLKIVDPIAASIDNIHNIIAQADRNAAMSVLVHLAEQHGIKAPQDPAIVRRLPPPEVKATIAAAGKENFEPYLPEDVKEKMRPFLAVRGAKNSHDTFTYFRDGVPEVWQALGDGAEYVAQMFRGADTPGESNIIYRTITGVAKMTRAGITASLDFGSRQILKDQISAFAVDQDHPPPFLTAMRGAMDAFGRTADYDDWLVNGGAGSALTSLDIDYLSRDIHRIFRETGTWNRMWNTFSHPLEAMQVLNERMDAAPRIGHMKLLQERGYTAVKAATRSRQAFLDFAQRGTWEILNAWQRATPFMRPGFLGLDQLGTAARTNPYRTAAYSLMAITAPAIGLYFLNYLQDEYGDLPEDRKYRNMDRLQKDTTFVLPEVAGLRLKIQTQPDIGFLFKAVPERFLENLHQNDPHAFDEMAWNTLGALVPPTIPAAAKPVLEQWANQSTNTGRSLIPASMEKAANYADIQYTENTTEVAKAVSRILGPTQGAGLVNISPIILDNYVRQYTGTMGFALMKAISYPFSTNGKPWEVSDVPFVQGFVARHSDMNAQPIRDFYEEKKEMDSILASQQLAQKRLKQGAEPDSELDAIMSKQAMTMSDTSSALDTLHNFIIGTQNNTEMTVHEKRQFIEQAYSDMINYSRAAVQGAQEFKQQLKEAQQ